MKILCNKIHYKYLKNDVKHQSENKMSVLKLSEKYTYLKKECLLKWNIKCKVVFLVYILNFTFWKGNPLFLLNRGL